MDFVDYRLFSIIQTIDQLVALISAYHSAFLMHNIYTIFVYSEVYESTKFLESTIAQFYVDVNRLPLFAICACTSFFVGLLKFHHIPYGDSRYFHKY